jgi:phage terminase small subunit
MPPVRGLTPKQARFVDEYLVDLNATQAAIRAGYSVKSAERIGLETLARPAVAAAIREAEAARSERVQVSADYVVENLTEIVERCMQRAPVMVRQGRETVHLIDDEGRHVWQFDARGATGALALIGRHLGMFGESGPPAGSPTRFDVRRPGARAA